MSMVLAAVRLGGGIFLAYWFKPIIQKHLEFGGNLG